MYLSVDIFLISLIIIIATSLVVLIGVLIYSYFIIKRYSSVLKRLYKSSFKGIDTERMRIASELHDLLSLYSISLSQDFDKVKLNKSEKELEEIIFLEDGLDKFKQRVHEIVEYMYPVSLTNLDWNLAFLQLSNQLSIGEIVILYENFASSSPKYDWLKHVYWVVKEIITNAIKHSRIKRAQILITDDNGFFIISIYHSVTQESKIWHESKFVSNKKGIGQLIILDRLRIIGAQLNTRIEDNIFSYKIKLKIQDDL